jgi:beta-N-acetylhexosaminidase
VLHCNGDMAEMTGIASRTLPLAGRSLERAGRALSALPASDTVAEADVRAEFARHVELVA